MTRIRAEVVNGGGEHRAVVSTDGASRALAIPAKDGEPGSSVNGGELLFAALATCYCNDIYREAARAGITVTRVEVEVEGEFGPDPGSVPGVVRYAATVEADAPEEEILHLMRRTDSVAEVHNSLRAVVPVELVSAVALRAPGGA